jgi:hypothetical protein
MGTTSGPIFCQVGDLSAVQLKVYLPTHFQLCKLSYVASDVKITGSYKFEMAWKGAVMAHFGHQL